jgi:Flp pilus assembly protein TadD
LALLQPLAASPDADRRLRHDLAAALVAAGERSAATQILGADLSPAEVAQAVHGYEALGPAPAARPGT